MPNITVKRCTTLNPATLLPTEEDGKEHHCCLTALDQVCTPCPDLLDISLENCENVLFVDGSAFRDPQTAQAAELVALTEACKLMTNKCVTIYTDSQYAFGVPHDFGALWMYTDQWCLDEL
ncbi:hypothetical protein H4Q32_002110 [Labeo rohita]|uniref:RNase H type-1 domain-containing protein n=1 Tax=Labeo rohita TaxID=84645 RepID=A0ABQ8MMF5_LABRO|nr:hypothetical protein H4Q32_002110 [Labeo rohita]